MEPAVEGRAERPAPVRAEDVVFAAVVGRKVGEPLVGGLRLHMRFVHKEAQFAGVPLHGVLHQRGLWRGHRKGRRGTVPRRCRQPVARDAAHTCFAAGVHEAFGQADFPGKRPRAVGVLVRQQARVGGQTDANRQPRAHFHPPVAERELASAVNGPGARFATIHAACDDQRAALHGHVVLPVVVHRHRGPLGKVQGAPVEIVLEHQFVFGAIGNIVAAARQDERAGGEYPQRVCFHAAQLTAVGRQAQTRRHRERSPNPLPRGRFLPATDCATQAKPMLDDDNAKCRLPCVNWDGA